jgi:XTP/dITP diphosphohydrolase
MARSQLKIWFVSSNENKRKEIQQIVATANVEILAAPLRIAELQFDDIREVVHRKTLEAFSQIQRPLLVEHTALYLTSLNGFPGGQTQHFWDCLGPNKFSEMFGGSQVCAKSVLGYCDGRRVHIFQGEVKGLVAKTPSLNTEFQWDSIFIPTEPRDYGIPFADLGDEKHKISMRRKALNEFCRHLKRPIE